MTSNQMRTIELLTQDAKGNENIIALILCGSLVKGTSSGKSDVDVFVVVSDEEFERRRTQKDYFCGTLFHQSKYPTSIDGKVVNKEFLQQIWVNGNECIKNNFSKIDILYSQDSEIAKILNDADKINHNKAENIKKFYALMKSNRHKATDDLNNIIQLKYCILNTVFFASRLVLEHNDTYFPCVKNMEKELKNCKDKPDNFIESIHKLLTTFSVEDLSKFYEQTEEYFKQYRFDDNIRKGYVIENEDFWFFNERPYAEI